jgi:cysteine desulfurase family protein
MDKVLYLDNAATSFPKPLSVWEAMREYFFEIGGNPGRSGHRLSFRASEILFETREVLGALFNIRHTERLIFTKNATEAINLALFGLLSPGDTVVTTAMEHNAVMRPLRYLERTRDVCVRLVPARGEGLLDLKVLSEALEGEPSMLVVNHASNVAGGLVDLVQVGILAKDAGVPLMVDAAQTAGCYPIDVEAMNISLLAFTGHKGLLGPQGTGGLYVAPGLEPAPFILGGTGSQSELEEQPGFWPDIHEGGTPNILGLVGLKAAVQFVSEEGVKKIRAHEEKLFSRFWEEAKDLPGIILYGPEDWGNRTAVVSFNVDGMDPAHVGYVLDKEFSIMVRPGLHCAPGAHRALGTFPRGTVRLAFGFFNTGEDVNAVLEALRVIGERGDG